jgi:hypothetical protein
LDFLSEIEECELDKHGYAFMTGGRMMGRNAGSGDSQPDMAALEKVGVAGGVGGRVGGWVAGGLIDGAAVMAGAGCQLALQGVEGHCRRDTLTATLARRMGQQHGARCGTRKLRCVLMLHTLCCFDTCKLHGLCLVSACSPSCLR